MKSRGRAQMRTKEIKTVGIVGAGTMGRRIGFGCIIRGVKVRIFDVRPEAAREALRTIRGLIEEREADGRLKKGTLAAALPFLSISPTLKDCVSGVDLVIENVPENVELKRRVFSEIDNSVGDDTILGTNTSSIPGSQIADAISRPEKFFNFNWGKPDDVRVEVMGHPGTARETIDAVMAFLRKLGIIPIQVKREIMGYGCNRIWRAVKKEVLFLIEGGYMSPEDIDRGWMLEWETEIGPCGSMDYIGLDVVRDIEMNYFRASGDPSDRPPRFLEEMIAQGKLGIKTGEGFYKYPRPAYKRPGWLKGEAG
jgi:3-hydroxybutyryl-CoA dehydrogenase